MKTSVNSRFSHCQILLLCIVCLTGCLFTPPVRVTTSIRTKSGTQHALPNVPPVPGKTTREQVNKEYSAFALELGIPNVSLGEFQQSQWAWAAEEAVTTRGGQHSGRLWTDRYILATFNQDNTVKTFEILSNKGLLAHFMKMQRAGDFPRLELSNPIALTGSMIDIQSENQVTMHLSSSGLAIGGITPIPITHFVSMKCVENGLKFDLSEITAFGKHFAFYASADELLTLIRWYEQEKMVAK